MTLHSPRGDDPLAQTFAPVRRINFATPPTAPAGHREKTAVAVEAPLTIEVKDVGRFTILCTPHQTLALAVGFVFSEGLIQSRQDLALAQHCPDDPLLIRLQLTDPPPPNSPGRNLIVASSCGMCGDEKLADPLAGLERVTDGLRLKKEALAEAAAEMKRRQALFARTGGTHAAGLFTAEGRLTGLAEDLGRHNALDKVIGLRLLSGQPLGGLGAALSGRVSLEMALKCARAGLELIAAVSAPTSLAVTAAERAGITLCCFVRGARAAVYTHPHRLIDLEAD